MGSEYKHNKAYIVVLSVNFGVYIFSLVMNGLAGPGGFPPLFYNSTAATSDLYYLDITPAGWTFAIWGIIFAWQVLWLLFAVSQLFRKGISGYIYYSPTLLPIPLHIVYIINSLLLVTWLILWDRASGDVTYLLPSFIVIALLPVMGVACLVISIHALEQHQGALYEAGLRWEVWCIRFLVQNGIAIYTTWVCIATLLNFAMMLTYYAGSLDVLAAGWVALSILAAEVLVYFLLDVFLLDRWTRYIFVPYAVFVWALSGCVSQNYPVDMSRTGLPAGDRERNPYRLLDMLCLACVLLLVKVGVMLWRHVKWPETRETGNTQDLVGAGGDYSNPSYLGSNPSVVGSYNQKL